MSQINLDTSPYFDDFDADKDFYKVLFKPGFPVPVLLEPFLRVEGLQRLGRHVGCKPGAHLLPEGLLFVCIR